MHRYSKVRSSHVRDGSDGGRLCSISGRVDKVKSRFDGPAMAAQKGAVARPESNFQVEILDRGSSKGQARQSGTQESSGENAVRRMRTNEKGKDGVYRPCSSIWRIVLAVRRKEVQETYLARLMWAAQDTRISGIARQMTRRRWSRGHAIAAPDRRAVWNDHRE